MARSTWGRDGAERKMRRGGRHDATRNKRRKQMRSHPSDGPGGQLAAGGKRTSPGTSATSGRLWLRLRLRLRRSLRAAESP